MSGCTLSKNESTLARLHDEMAAKKKERPKSYPTEEKLGVHYYPDCDYVSNEDHDEFGAPGRVIVINTHDSADKVRDFYESDLGAKAVLMTPPVYSIQRDYNGKHYEVTYGRFDADTTITIKVMEPQR